MTYVPRSRVPLFPIEDGHQSNSRNLYIYISNIRISLFLRWDENIPNFKELSWSTLDPDTFGCAIFWVQHLRACHLAGSTPGLGLKPYPRPPPEGEEWNAFGNTTKTWKMHDSNIVKTWHACIQFCIHLQESMFKKHTLTWNLVLVV